MKILDLKKSKEQRDLEKEGEKEFQDYKKWLESAVDKIPPNCNDLNHAFDGQWSGRLFDLCSSTLSDEEAEMLANQLGHSMRKEPIKAEMNRISVVIDGINIGKAESFSVLSIVDLSREKCFKVEQEIPSADDFKAIKTQVGRWENVEQEPLSKENAFKELVEKWNACVPQTYFFYKEATEADLAKENEEFCKSLDQCIDAIKKDLK